jgi:hypothetical protein
LNEPDKIDVLLFGHVIFVCGSDQDWIQFKSGAASLYNKNGVNNGTSKQNKKNLNF